MAEDEDGACLEDPSRLAQSGEKFASILPYGHLRFFPLPESEMYRIARKIDGSYAPADPGQLGASLRQAMAR